MDSPRITVHCGCRRVLQDICAERALKTVFENDGVVSKVSIAVGDVNVLSASDVKLVLVVSDCACLRLEANWACAAAESFEILGTALSSPWRLQ
eukprot:6080501-Pleurochrysis_carterae.AAC.1